MEEAGETACLSSFRGPMVANADDGYWVYVLWSSTAERFYIGVTENVARRVAQHNAGVSRWTHTRGPWTLVWSEHHGSLSAARRIEKELKRQKGGNGFYQRTGLDRDRFA